MKQGKVKKPAWLPMSPKDGIWRCEHRWPRVGTSVLLPTSTPTLAPGVEAPGIQPRSHLLSHLFLLLLTQSVGTRIGCPALPRVSLGLICLSESRETVPAKGLGQLPGLRVKTRPIREDVFPEHAEVLGTSQRHRE